jgi:hypothetical protein
MATIFYNGTAYTCPFVGALPPLTADEERELQADISARGVIVPVVITDEQEVIDGHNRLKIAAALGLPDVPMKVFAGMTAAQKLEMAADLNLHRRQLTRQQMREIVAQKLRADPSRSNNAIAAEVGVDDKTVAATRTRLESTSEIPKLNRRRGRDGRARSVKTALPSKPSPSPSPGQPTCGNRRGPYPWWPNLGWGGGEIERLGKELRLLTKIKTTDRTLPPVQKIIDRLRCRVGELEQMIGSGKGVS